MFGCGWWTFQSCRNSLIWRGSKIAVIPTLYSILIDTSTEQENKIAGFLVGKIKVETLCLAAGLNEGKTTSLQSIGSAGTKVHLRISGIIVPEAAQTVFGGMNHANVRPGYQIPVLPPGPAADLFNLVAQSQNSPIFGGAPVKLSVRVPTPIESQENEKEHSDINQGNSQEEARQTSITAAADSGSPTPKGGQR